MKVKSYTELEVWKKGVEIVDLVYQVTISFPVSEQFGLATQMQRASISIPSNIAEGFARRHAKEFQQFCPIALGSCAELETQTIIAERRGYVSTGQSTQLKEYLDQASRMPMNLIKSLGS